MNEDITLLKIREAAAHAEALDAGKALLVAADMIAELESRCAEKDASIAQLIEQLQKAEAQNATFRCAVCDDAFDDRQSFDAHREGAGHNYRLPDRRE